MHLLSPAAPPWPAARAIRAAGIATGNAPFPTAIPAWAAWPAGPLRPSADRRERAGQLPGYESDTLRPKCRSAVAGITSGACDATPTCR